MKADQLSASVVALTLLAMIVTAGTRGRSHCVQVQNGDDDHESRIECGLDIAPVPLNLEGKDRALVGLGRYSARHQESRHDL
jgi:hypothetical protein